MTPPRRYPANTILAAGGLIIPFSVFLFALLLANKNPDTGESQNVVQLFPAHVVLIAIVALAGILALMKVSIFRATPMRWWIALLWSSLVLILAIVGLIGVATFSSPLDPESQWRSGTVLLSVIGAQLAFVVATFVILRKARSTERKTKRSAQ